MRMAVYETDIFISATAPLFKCLFIVLTISEDFAQTNQFHFKKNKKKMMSNLIPLSFSLLAPLITIK